MKMCTVDGCINKHMAIGFCNTHYRRHRRNTPIDKLSCYDMDVKQRLQSFIQINNECWEWQGAKNRKGYGQISIFNKRQIAHRVSYKVYKGEIPTGYLVCHACDNPCCINPDHLFTGTVKDNAQDMLAKNRNRPMSGEKMEIASYQKML